MNQKSLAQQDELSLEEINADLMEQLDQEANNVDYVMGLLASALELAGHMAVSFHQDKHHLKKEADVNDVVKSISTILPRLTYEQQSAVAHAVKFRDEIIKFNKLHSDLKPAWRDDYPLHVIEQLNFIHVYNRYY